MRNGYLLSSLLICIISGSSKFLISLSLLLASGMLARSLILRGRDVPLNQIYRWCVFASMSAVALLLMPPENAWKFLLSLTSLLLCYEIISNICLLSGSSRRRVMFAALVVIFAGDLIHFSGLLGDGMDAYKEIVRFDPISNIEREMENSILGLRYHGWFGEPSYHGIFSGLLCAALMRPGKRLLVSAVFSVLFVVCPSPTMVIGFFIGQAFSMRTFTLRLTRTRIYLLIGGLLIFGSLSAFFLGRIYSLVYAVLEVYSGGYVLNSEAVRLVYPLLSLMDHWAGFGLGAQSVLCVEAGECASEAVKFPFISYLIFFGGVGLACVLMFYSLLYRVSLARAAVALVLGSVISGGGGFVMHFALIVGFLLAMRHLKAVGA